MTLDAFRLALATLLAERRMTNTDLAARAGLSPSSVSRYLSGTRWPSPDAIDRIATALSLDDHGTLRLHVLASLPERYHGRVVLTAGVIRTDLLFATLAQVGIGGKEQAA